MTWGPGAAEGGQKAAKDKRKSRSKVAGAAAGTLSLGVALVSLRHSPINALFSAFSVDVTSVLCTRLSLLWFGCEGRPRESQSRDNAMIIHDNGMLCEQDGP